jgi:hypothetical protein
MTAPPAAPAAPRIPLWAKLAYSAFVAVLVPFYLHAYGPTNFLYFCDVALLLGLAALWLENSLLASMPACGILVPQLLWVIDFLGGLVGHFPVGMTKYMFDPGIPLFARGLSLFHGWLPFVLVAMVARLGYDRRAFAAWTALAWALMLVGYFLMPPPPPDPADPNRPVNINYVFGPSDQAAQTWMAPGLFFALLMVGYPLALFLPAHLLLRWLFPPPAAARRPE